MIPLRFASLFLSSSLLSVVALVGCAESGASSAEASFADATPAQLERVYSASSADDLSAAVFLSANFAGQNDPGSCPAIVTDGQDTTVAGDCTTEDGVRVEGSIVMHNMFGLEEDFGYIPTQPTSIKLDFHVTTLEGERIDLDGRVDFDKGRFQGDLTIGADGVDSTSRLTMDCEIDPSCAASPGSKIELSDLGSGRVEGTIIPWNTQDRVTVRGSDVLVIDVAFQDEDRCVPYEIGDKRGTVCPRNLDLLFSSFGFEGLPPAASAFAASPSPGGSWPLRSAKR